MKAEFEINDVEYVNVAYDIENIFELYDKRRELSKKREIINWYIEKMDWTEETYKH